MTVSQGISRAREAEIFWGPDGARRAAREADALVVVDVLSFSTTVEMALSAGVEVYPARLDDMAAAQLLARRVGAVLAGKRGTGGVSLSPLSTGSLPQGSRVVLPSPNGAECCVSAKEQGGTVLLGGIRNAEAVARALRPKGPRVAVVAAGEIRQDGIRGRAIEDWLGAGAILSYLPVMRMTKEATQAVRAFQRAKGDLYGRLSISESGRELLDRGYPEDVLAASALNVSATVPLLSEGGYFVDIG